MWCFEPWRYSLDVCLHEDVRVSYGSIIAGKVGHCLKVVILVKWANW